MGHTAKDPRGVAGGPSSDRFPGGDRGEDSADQGAVQFPLRIASIQKGDAEVRVALDEFKGNLTIDVRLFETFTTANVMMPTKRGITLGLARLPELAAALADAETKARAMGLLDG